MVIAAVSIGGCKADEPQTTEQKLDAIFKAPDGWSEADRQAIALFAEGKFDESFAIHQQWVDKHPEFAEAHYSLADSHFVRSVQLQGDGPEAEVKRKEHLQAAAAHFRRYRTLAKDEDPEVRRLATATLARILSPEGLNELREAEEVARDWVGEHPENMTAYGTLAQILRAAGKADQVPEVLRDAKSAVRADDRDDYAELVIAHLEASAALPREQVESLLEEVRMIYEAELQTDARSWKAVSLKADALRLRANRLETNPARKRALLAEAEELADTSNKLALEAVKTP